MTGLEWDLFYELQLMHHANNGFLAISTHGNKAKLDFSCNFMGRVFWLMAIHQTFTPRNIVGFDVFQPTHETHNNLYSELTKHKAKHKAFLF